MTTETLTETITLPTPAEVAEAIIKFVDENVCQDLSREYYSSDDYVEMDCGYVAYISVSAHLVADYTGPCLGGPDYDVYMEVDECWLKAVEDPCGELPDFSADEITKIQKTINRYYNIKR